MTTKEFIQKAKEIHNNKYDYSKVNYINAKSKIIIICPEHGEFEQTPIHHLEGKGCSKCSNNKKSTTKEFIQKARKVHGDNYNYSKVNYKNSVTKVIIICSKHGEFEQTPANHLTGKGCPKCAGKNMTTERFVQEAKKIHNNKYDYSKVNYVNCKNKITIICPEHGEFKQRAMNHIRKIGCPKCNGQGFSHLTYNECKAIVQPIMARIMISVRRTVTQFDYFEWWRNNKKFCQATGIPFKPDQYYRKNK